MCCDKFEILVTGLAILSISYLDAVNVGRQHPKNVTKKVAL